MSIFTPAEIGVVAIGRNEGARLQQCLMSVVDCVAWVVYVDSGSTDGSVAFAKSVGVDVVQLDMSKPFTAAVIRAQQWISSSALCIKRRIQISISIIA